jgi:hypothetical protein
MACSGADSAATSALMTEVVSNGTPVKPLNVTGAPVELEDVVALMKEDSWV